MSINYLLCVLPEAWVVVVDGGACVVVVVEVVVAALYNASFLQFQNENKKKTSIRHWFDYEEKKKMNFQLHLNQYFADDLQFTSDTKWQMNVFWSNAVKLAHRKSCRIPYIQWW